MAPPDGLGCRPHPAPGDFGRLHGPARRPWLSAPSGPRRLRPVPWSRPTASVVGPARHCRPATSPDSPRPTAPSGLIRLPGPVLALWEDRSREHTGCARRLPHDSAVFMRPMRGALRNDPPRAPFSAPIGRRGAGRPLAARKNGNTEACGTCGTRSGRSGVVKSFGVVFFRSGGDGGQGGAAAVAAGVVGVEHVGQALQGGLGEVSAFAVLPLLVALAGRIRSGGVRSRCRGRPGRRLRGA